MAVFAQKTLQFVRAPDENVFIPRKQHAHRHFPLPKEGRWLAIILMKLIGVAFNLIEILCLSLPFEWWLSKDQYQRLNYYVMGVLYSPLLLITAWVEVRAAKRINWNRRNGGEDDAIRQEWESLIAEVDFDVSDRNWDEIVRETKPNVEVPTAVLEVLALKEQVNTLMNMVKRLVDEKDGPRTSTHGTGSRSFD